MNKDRVERLAKDFSGSSLPNDWCKRRATWAIRMGWIHSFEAVEYVTLCRCDKGQVKRWDAINTWYEDCDICNGKGIVLKQPTKAD